MIISGILLQTQIQSNIIVEEKMPQLNGAMAAGPIPLWRFLLPSSHYHILCVIDMLLCPLNRSIHDFKYMVNNQYTILIICYSIHIIYRLSKKFVSKVSY